MDDRELMDKLKEAAEKEDIPESLKPENMMKRLEQQEKRRKRPLRYWKAGLAAAAACVVLAGLGVHFGETVHEKEGETLMAKAEVQNTAATAGRAASEGSDTEKPDTQEGTLEDTKTADQVLDAQGLEDQAEEPEVQEEIPETEAEEGITKAQAQGGSLVPVAGSYQELYDWMKEEWMISYEADVYSANEAAIVEDSAPAYGEKTTGTMDTVSADFAATTTTSTGVSSKTEALGDYSATNTREANVDEADVVKTDGQYLYILNKNQGITILKAGIANLQTVGVLKPEDIQEEPKEFYVDGDLLQILVTARETSMETEEEESWDNVYYVSSRTVTRVLTYDISDRANPVRTGSYEQDGDYVSSRKNGTELYLFTSYCPVQGTMTQEAETFVPRAGQELLPCQDIYLPFEKMDYGERNYLVISSLNQENPNQAISRKALAGGAGLFYVSENHIYVANSRWRDGTETTEIAAFSYEDGEIRAQAAGTVKGTVHDSFCLDEYEGYLRVVTTCWETKSYEDGAAISYSYERTNGIYIFDEQLDLVGHVDGLARNEEIKSARFLGDMGYFVTYENTDPLFSVDLHDPENPQILGELKITGFSDYLHFYGEDHLLGLGWETDPDTGARKGLKLSMFDISDPSNVQELHKLVLSNVTDCPGTWNYKSVLASPEKNLIGFSFYDNQGEGYYGLFSYDEQKGFQERLMENLEFSSETFSIYGKTRGLYVGDKFYVAGSGGVILYQLGAETERLEKLEKLSW